MGLLNFLNDTFGDSRNSSANRARANDFSGQGRQSQRLTETEIGTLDLQQDNSPAANLLRRSFALRNGPDVPIPDDFFVRPVQTINPRTDARDVPTAPSLDRQVAERQATRNDSAQTIAQRRTRIADVLDLDANAADEDIVLELLGILGSGAQR